MHRHTLVRLSPRTMADQVFEVSAGCQPPESPHRLRANRPTRCMHQVGFCGTSLSLSPTSPGFDSSAASARCQAARHMRRHQVRHTACHTTDRHPKSDPRPRTDRPAAPTRCDEKAGCTDPTLDLGPTTQALRTSVRDTWTLGRSRSEARLALSLPELVAPPLVPAGKKCDGDAATTGSPSCFVGRAYSPGSMRGGPPPTWP